MPISLKQTVNQLFKGIFNRHKFSLWNIPNQLRNLQRIPIAQIIRELWSGFQYAHCS